MIALAVLAVLVQQTGEAHGRVVLADGPRPLVGQESATPDESQDGAVFHDAVRCWLELAPAEVEIGEPIECTLHVVYPTGIRVRVKDEALKLDDSWIVLEESRVLTVDEPPNRVTRAIWVVASLEPGERVIDIPSGQYEAWGTLHGLEPEPARVRVRPALDEDEDAPRPAAGFRPPPEGGELSLRPLWIAGGALGTLALGAGFVAWRARRRRPAPAAPLGPRERLARLGDEGFEDPRRVRTLHYRLSAALRELADQRVGVDRRGATDEEWLVAAASDAGLTGDLHAEFAALLSKCAGVKYGQQRPTRWAAEETLAAGRALAERLMQPAEVAR